MNHKAKPLTQFLLVRHAETQWNIEQRHLGTRDVDLASTAKKHVTILTRRLAQYPVNIIYSSPLSRCIHTIQPASEVFDLPIIIRKELIERNLGSWEGKSPKDLEPTHQGYHFPDSAYTGIFHISGAETLADLEKRLRIFLRMAKKKHPNQTVLVITHSGVIWTILHRIVNNPPLEFFWPGNCSISTVYYQGPHITMQSYEQIF